MKMEDLKEIQKAIITLNIEVLKISHSLERLTEIVLGKCPHCGAPIKHLEGDCCSNCGEKIEKSATTIAIDVDDLTSLLDKAIDDIVAKFQDRK